jgi:hypothetical protein
MEAGRPSRYILLILLICDVSGEYASRSGSEESELIQQDLLVGGRLREDSHRA